MPVKTTGRIAVTGHKKAPTYSLVARAIAALGGGRGAWKLNEPKLNQSNLRIANLHLKRSRVERLGSPDPD
jgi:hypothetical protein